MEMQEHQMWQAPAKLTEQSGMASCNECAISPYSSHEEQDSFSMKTCMV